MTEAPRCSKSSSGLEGWLRLEFTPNPEAEATGGGELLEVGAEGPGPVHFQSKEVHGNLGTIGTGEELAVDTIGVVVNVGDRGIWIVEGIVAGV